MQALTQQPGFSLIELLMVVAIISILVAFLSAGYGEARVRAKDAERVAAVRHLRSALEIYETDNNTYPVASWYRLGICSANPEYPNLFDILESYLVKQIETEIDGLCGLYRTNTSGRDYCLAVPTERAGPRANDADCLEPATHYSVCVGGQDCN